MALKDDTIDFIWPFIEKFVNLWGRWGGAAAQYIGDWSGWWVVHTSSYLWVGQEHLALWSLSRLWPLLL